MTPSPSRAPATIKPARWSAVPTSLSGLNPEPLFKASPAGGLVAALAARYGGLSNFTAAAARRAAAPPYEAGNAVITLSVPSAGVSVNRLADLPALQVRLPLTN